MNKVFIIMLVSFAVYSNTLGMEFTYDDIGIIVENRVLHSMDIKRIITAPYWSVAPKTAYRPAVMLSYALNYYFGRLNPWGYHLLNVLLHALNSALLFVLLRKFLNERTAFFSALLFAAHPIHTEAVANVVGRAELLGALFSLISFYAYVSKNPKLYALSLLSFLLALLSKETAIALIFIIPLYELLFAGKIEKRFFGYLLPFLFFILLRLAVLDASPFYMPGISPLDNPLASTSLYSRMLTVVRILAMYLKLMFFPLGMSADYSYNQIPVSTSLFELDVIFSAAAIFLSAIAFRKSAKEIKFGIIFFFAAVLPASNLVLIRTIAAERLLYFPSIGFFIAAAAFIDRINAKDASKLVLILLLLTPYSVLTAERNKVWQDNEALWSATVKTSPNSARAHAALGAEYLRKKMNSKGFEEMNTALSIYPDIEFARLDLGIVYLELKEYEKAKKEFEEALKINPNSRTAKERLAHLHLLLGSPLEAIKEAARVVKEYPDSYLGHYILGLAYSDLRLYEEAEEEFRKALELNPYSDDAKRNLMLLANLTSSALL